ncbi:hypothetical protein SK128_017503 [Halocaridina rubra]|uniref:Uncharacterized protein n=1 Tax=Halocaridina rubra TaxID=373956 RepID=A0AAN8ZXY4_HALRR
MSVLVCVVMSLLTGSALGHESFFGRCPSSPEMDNFDMEKFEGVWYLLESFDNYLKCVVWNITKGDSLGSWKLLETKESGVWNTFGITPNPASVSQPDPTNHPARLRITWPASLAGSSAFTVYKTDYDNYAGVFECQNIGLFHRQNGAVLSRTPTLKVDLKQMARIGTDKIKVAYYRAVKQDHCLGRTSSDSEGNTWRGVPGFFGSGPSGDAQEDNSEIPDVEFAILNANPTNT